MDRCPVCKEELAIDEACQTFFVGPKDAKFSVHHSCASKLREKITVLKLRIEGTGVWLGFRTDEDCTGLLTEILELAKESEPGDTLTIEVDSCPLSEVLAWPDFPGW